MKAVHGVLRYELKPIQIKPFFTLKDDLAEKD